MKNKKQIRTRPLAFSKLTQRLLIINVVALAIIGGGVFLLDHNRRALTQDRLNVLETDVRLYADDLKNNAIPFEPSEPYEIDIAKAEQVLGEINSKPMHRLRLYDRLNQLIIDTAGPINIVDSITIDLSVDVSELPPPVTPQHAEDLPSLDIPPTPQPPGKFLHVITSWLGSLNPLPNNKPSNTPGLSDNGQCAPETPVLRNPEGHHVLNTSVVVLPLASNSEKLTDTAERLAPFTGCLLLTANTLDIDQAVRKHRMELLLLSAIALSITLLLSLYLARSIAYPLRQLAAAAEDATKEPTAKHTIPDLSDRRDEIGDLSVALRQMGNSLSERITAIERFAGDVAHELKNPLASLSSTNELLERYGNDNDFRRHLARQADDINRMDRLISEILDDARLDSELANALTKRVELDNLLITLTQVYNETGLVGKTRLDYRNEAKIKSVVYGDEQQLARVIQNLVDNSIAFSPLSGLILIRLSHQDGSEDLITCRHTYNQQQIDWFNAGSALNYIKENS